MRTPALLIALAIAAPCLAQPCTPTWDRTIGTPGASTGYVGALGEWNGLLIAGGSFPGIAGVPGTKYLAAYDRATNTWSSVADPLGEGISNAFVNSFAEYNGDLYVGGFFANANGLDHTKSITRWDGTEWHALGETGWAFDSVNAVWTMLTSDIFGGTEKLYVGGGFSTIAGLPAGDVASWDGTTWTPLASSITLNGNNPVIFAMAEFDDGSGPALYVGGRFTQIDGVNATMIARYNGSTWSPVGTNLVSRTSQGFALGEIDGMLVYDDGTGPALYVCGYRFTVQGEGNASVAKWNGTTWTRVGQDLSGRSWSLAAFDDGNGMGLYCAGTQPAGGYIYKLVNGTWVSVSGGADAQGIKLLAQGDRLVAGGSFNTIGGGATGKIAEYVACGSCPDVDFNQDGGIDVADIASFFDAFTGTDPNPLLDPDVNQDGGLDVADIDAFFTAFAGGPC